MTRKSDTIGYKEFNKLIGQSGTNHDPLPSEVLYDDENNNQLEETLIGMEYDIEDLDELQDDDDDDDYDDEENLELSEDPSDADADKSNEFDEGRSI